MDWEVLPAALTYNIDPNAWKYFSNPAAGFGYKVVQRRQSLLVSAPLEEYNQNRRGQIYDCKIGSPTCRPISVSEPNFAVNMSLGLTLSTDTTSSTFKTMACGPTIPRDCKTITTYNGICFVIEETNRIDYTVPSSLEDCPTSGADIAFLLDGSGSVSQRDFNIMKTFVKDLIHSLLGKDVQFAVAQYSRVPQIHYYFDDFRKGTWESNIDQIQQQQGATFTAAAIKHVVQEAFSNNRGSRQNVKKVLIVVTDGESHDAGELSSAASEATKKNIARFAIGVGSAFSSDKAKNELETIASSLKHVFRVDSFEALHAIRDTLQSSIFSIEGSDSSGEKFQKEMAQEGFSAAYVPGGFLMGTVGAREWRGGYEEYSLSKSKSTFREHPGMNPDSYLGYSMAVATVFGQVFTILGAPRYEHTGAVIVFTSGKTNQVIELTKGGQSGMYFGAEVCAMDVDGDGHSDQVLISAPMYKQRDREGRVYACRINSHGVDCSTLSILEGIPGEKGRFGVSVAPLPDLNGDRYNDLAIGAPFENDGQGSIYIFHGENVKINLIYSQRIPGSDVRAGLQFFGLSISQSSYDLSEDSLPDLAVGTKGTVFILRSKPIVTMQVRMTFNPTKIPTNDQEPDQPLTNNAQVCFTMKLFTRSGNIKVKARINYTLTLDYERKVNYRAYIKEKQREVRRSIILDLEENCIPHSFSIKESLDDSVTDLSNEVVYSFEGLPSSADLSPSLAQQVERITYHKLGFEINCGPDNKCVDDLKVDFNFTRSSEIRVGIDELLNITVSVESRGENSYNSRVVLRYPTELSFRRFTRLQGRVECTSVDSLEVNKAGQSDCTIDKPIFKSKAKAFFIISYGILSSSNSKLNKKILITANATSDNDLHSPESERFKKKEIDVKYSVFVAMSSSLIYTNFSAGKNYLQKPVEHPVMVLNLLREFNLTVIFRIPIQLGDKDIWVNANSLQIPGCRRDKYVKPTVKDFVDKLKKNATVDCTVARCGVFLCDTSMKKDDRNFYRISGNLSAGWLEQIGLISAKFLLVSTVTLDYDRNQYIFFSTESQSNPPIQRIETEVEVYTEVDLTKEIVGGTVGGLVLLALITAGLYKAGFFKSQFKQMIENEAGGENGSPDTEPAAPDQQQ